jgi:hypothetical protein
MPSYICRQLLRTHHNLIMILLETNGFDSRQKRDFYLLHGVHIGSCVNLVSFSRGQGSQDANLIIHLHPLTRLTLHGVIHLLYSTSKTGLLWESLISRF